MSKADILEELPKLTSQDRAEISARLSELEGIADHEWLATDELSEADKALLDARLAEYEKNPNTGESWENVESRILARLRA